MLSTKFIKYEVSEAKSMERGQLANQLKTRAFRFKIRVLVLSTESIKYEVFEPKSKRVAGSDQHAKQLKTRVFGSKYGFACAVSRVYKIRGF